MEKKINIAEILEDCPKGIELYSPLFGELKFEGISHTLILCKDVYREIVSFEPDGKYNSKYHKAECMLFPSKDVRTWEGFQKPFKDGDILYLKSVYEYESIFINKIKELHEPGYYKYANLIRNSLLIDDCPVIYKKDVKEIRLATEEEKEKLFQAIKDNGYNWDEETKSLVKLIEPKFKVGDRIRMKNSNEEYTIIKVNDYTCQYSNQYCSGLFGMLVQDDYELVPNKFDITTLKPFDKVLVRNDKKFQWQACIFSHIDKALDSYCNKYVTTNKSYPYMIPYEGNEHLLGTTDDCDEFYKTWE